MEKYKASSNNLSESATEDSKVAKEQKSTESTQAALQAGMEFAEKIPVAAPYVKAAKGIDKLTGGKLTKTAAEITNKTLKSTPGGSQIQNAINKSNDSGLTQAVGKAAAAKNGNSSGVKSSTGNVKGAGMASFKLGASKVTSTDGNIVGGIWDKLPKPLKIKIIIGASVCLLFLSMITSIVAADDDYQNLSLTNNSGMSGSGMNGSRACTPEEVENRLFYIGDSRMVEMQQTLTNSEIEYIAQSAQGYEWYKNTALPSIESILQSQTDSIAILALGVNDLHNIDNYINAYNELIAKYPGITFYVLSVNPVDESKTGANGYSVTNSDIENFNKKLADNFPNNYMDSYSSLNINTHDGVHYDADTYRNLNSYITSNISSSGKVMCGGGGIGAVSAGVEGMANWYIENVSRYDSNLLVECPLIGTKVRADCTGFAVAYMSYVSGSNIPISHTGDMVYPNGNWAQTVAGYGWKAYSSDEIGSLQTGDVMIAHSGALYSKKGQHAEIYIDASSTFGWGSAKSSYPTSNSVTTNKSGSHTIFNDSRNDYITIYRYEG